MISESARPPAPQGESLAAFSFRRRWAGRVGAILLVLGATGCAGGGLPAPTAGPDRLQAPSYFTLANGLEARVLERPAPLQASLLIVGAGARDEGPDEEGMAHLLEHLVFEGTARRAKEDLFREIYGLGAYVNAFTREDFTGYIAMGAPEAFDRLLDIQADLVFGAKLEARGLEGARRVVREEIRRAAADPVAGEEDLHRSWVYRGTPYAHSALGSDASVARIGLDAVATFYRRHYGPNHTLALFIGPLSPAEVRAAAERHLATRPAGPPLPAAPPPAPPGGGGLVAAETGAPRKALVMNLLLAPAEADGAMLDALAAVLQDRLRAAFEGSGRPAILRTEAAPVVLRDLVGLEVRVEFPPSTPEAGVLKAVRAAIQRLREGGVSEEAWARVRTGLLADELYLAERIHYFAMAKAARALAWGPGAVAGELARLETVEAAEVSAAARRLLDPDRFAATLFRPGTGGPAAGGRPSPPERVELGNGLVLLVQEIPASRIFAAHLLARGRALAEPAGKAGLADFLHRMLPRGTVDRSAEEIARALQAMGGRLEVAGDPTTPFGDFYTARDFSGIRLEALAEAAPQALALLADLVARPRLDPEDIGKVRKEKLVLIETEEGSPRRVGEEALLRLLLGSSPLARSVTGTRASVAGISRQDLEAFRARYFAPDNLILSVVSGLPADQVISMVRGAFGQWPRKGVAWPEVVLPPTRPAVVHEALGKPQASLWMGTVVPEVPERDRPALQVATAILNARLFLTVRERAGLAYALEASLSFPGRDALLTISVGTARASLERVRDAVRAEFGGLEEAVTPDEVTRRVNSLTGRIAMRRLSSVNRAFYLGVAEYRHLPHRYGEDYRALLGRVTADEVREAVRRYFSGDLAVVFVE